MALLLAGLTACASGKSAEYNKITAQEAKEKMDGDLPSIILDVRNEDEYAEKYIADSVLIPAGEIKTRAASELPDKDALILVYCQGGGRSESAARALVEMGYTNVYDFGGIINWPYETAGE
jgi:rhodanese-related sulfurtransferase